MALPVSFFTQTLADETVKNNGTPETSNWSVPIITLTAGNLVATTTLIGNLKSAVAGLVLGIANKEEIISSRTFPLSGPSNDPLAQRENKWLCRYHGNTLNQKFQVSIPTADLSLKIAHSEFVDLTAGPGLALKTAFEALVVSPDDAAETTTLDSVQFVGRNT